MQDAVSCISSTRCNGYSFVVEDFIIRSVSLLNEIEWFMFMAVRRHRYRKIVILRNVLRSFVSCESSSCSSLPGNERWSRVWKIENEFKFTLGAIAGAMTELYS